jgi:hypothetical protein
MALDDNGRRLKAILEAFEIPISEVGLVCGVSRSMVSRILSENDPLNGNDVFWLRVEKALGKLVEGRKGQVFKIGAIELAKVEGLKVVAELKKAS